MRVSTSRKGLGLLFKLRYAHDCMYIYIGVDILTSSLGRTRGYCILDYITCLT